jgi:hypothetical protein
MLSFGTLCPLSPRRLSRDPPFHTVDSGIAAALRRNARFLYRCALKWLVVRAQPVMSSMTPHYILLSLKQRTLSGRVKNIRCDLNPTIRSQCPHAKYKRNTRGSGMMSLVAGINGCGQWTTDWNLVVLVKLDKIRARSNDTRISCANEPLGFKRDVIMPEDAVYWHKSMADKCC